MLCLRSRSSYLSCHDIARHVVDVAAVHEEVAILGVAQGRQQPGVTHAGPRNQLISVISYSEHHK